MIYKPAERAKAIEEAINGLRSGTPLAVTCREDGMPNEDTIMMWAKDDEDLARSIARAREVGFDQIALDGLRIVDDVDEDPASRRVRSDYRLKLLAKWDPKRYGELLKLGNPDGSNIDSAAHVEASRARVIRGD